MVFCTNGWQEYGLIGEGCDVFNYMFPRKLDPAVAPISTAVGILGMLGMTAYSGMYVQCEPKAGETVVVSAVSGGVGQSAAQIAKVCGCRVVGIAGPEQKCAFARTKLGLDACVSYKSPTYAQDLKAACPNGIDCYFENVGGAVYEGVLPLLNQNSRISICGLISQSNDDSVKGDPRKAYLARGKEVFDAKNVKAMGLFVGDFVKDHQARFLSDMAGWIKAGKMAYAEDVKRGLDAAPKTFVEMMFGETFGKTLVQIGPDPTVSAAGGWKIGHVDDVLQAKL